MLHKTLALCEKDSGFDDFVRIGLTKMAQKAHGDDANLSELDVVFRVFEKNSYE